MAQTGTISAWILLFFGLYSLGAGIGELRQPGLWKSMVEELIESAGLRFLTGILCLVMGAAVYLTNPWFPDDWLSVAVTMLGAAMVVEGIGFLAAGDHFMKLSLGLMGGANRIWATLSCLLGIAMIVAAMARL